MTDFFHFFLLKNHKYRKIPYVMHENTGRALEISEHAHARENVLYFRAHAKTSRGGHKKRRWHPKVSAACIVAPWWFSPCGVVTISPPHHGARCYLTIIFLVLPFANFTMLTPFCSELTRLPSTV